MRRLSVLKYRLAYLIAALAAAGFAVAGAAAQAGETAPALPLTQAQWNSPDTDDIAFLLRTPGECLARAADADTKYQVEVGRAAFSSPFLFGGTAARSGLSCNSCHRDGRDNPDFFLEGLSGEPGTADVTSSLFSKTREDNVFNPVPIPTLLDIAGKASFGSTAPQPSIHAFVTSAVNDEFQGAAAPAVIDAVAIYVAHLQSADCPEGETAQTVELAMNDIARMLGAAEEAMRRGEAAAADFLLLSAQHKLGLIHERYRGPRLVAERALAAALSRRIADLRRQNGGDLTAAAAKMPAVLGELERIGDRLRKKQRRSLYNKKQLRRLIDERRPE